MRQKNKKKTESNTKFIQNCGWRYKQKTVYKKEKQIYLSIDPKIRNMKSIQSDINRISSRQKMSYSLLPKTNATFFFTCLFKSKTFPMFHIFSLFSPKRAISFSKHYDVTEVEVICFDSCFLSRCQECFILATHKRTKE